MNNITEISLYHLLTNEFYFDKVFSFIDDDMYEDFEAKIFSAIRDSYLDDEKKPSMFLIEQKLSKELEYNLNNEKWQNIKNLKTEYKRERTLEEIEELIKVTKDYFKYRKLRVAIAKSAEILEDDKQKDKTQISGIVESALNLSFETNLGQTFNDYERRWEFFYSKEEDNFRVPIKNKEFNRITNGGWKKKSVNFLVGGTGVGKCLCGDTLIKIKNKKTGEIKEISMLDFYNLLKGSLK